MVVFFLRFLSFICANIGFKGCRVLGYCTGVFIFDVLSVRKKIVIHNIDIAFGHSFSSEQKKRLGRMSYINFMTTIFETMGSYKLFQKANIEFENKEVFDNALAQNQGIYMIMIHMGNFELFSHIYKTYGVYSITKDMFKNNYKANHYIEGVRKRNGLNSVKNHEYLTRIAQLFDALNNKKLVCMMVDQKRPKGEQIPFFGKMANTNNSLAKLFFRKNAPVLPVIITRKKTGSFTVKYFDEFVYTKNPAYSLKENITEFTKQMNKTVEKMILTCPQEYMWGHNRWNYKG